MLKTPRPGRIYQCRLLETRTFGRIAFRIECRNIDTGFKFVPGDDTVTGHKDSVCPAGRRVGIHMPITTAKLDLMRELRTVKKLHHTYMETFVM